jgi:hypothetical protein
LLARREQNATFAWVSCALFVVALIVTHTYHEAWRDELHCWSVGRNATGLRDLMFGDRRYDGHPFLWYYCVHLASRIYRGVAALHALTITIAAASAYLWLRHSGAPRFVRLLLLPSYLFFYEYSVVCRSYILGSLLLFAFVIRYRREAVRYLELSILLGLLALTSVYGAFMSGALAMFLFTRGVALFRRDANGERRWLELRSGYLLGLFVYLGFVGLTAATSMPPKDEIFAPTWYVSQMGFVNVKKALVNFWWGFVPTNEDWSSQSYLGLGFPTLEPYLPWLGAGLLLCWLFALRRAPMVAVSFLVVALAMGAFGQMKYPGGLRHVGNIFLFLLACAALVRREVGHGRRLPLLWGLLTCCLLVQIRANVNAVRQDVKRPFSGALQAAKFVAEKFPSDTLLIGSNDFIASGVGGYLDRGVLFAESGDYGQSVVSHNRRAWPTSASLSELARRNLAGRDRVILLLSSPFYLSAQGVRFSLRLVTDSAIVADERLWIYEARREDAP